MEFLQSPAGIGAAVAAVAVLVFLFRKGGSKSMGAPKKKAPNQIEKLVANGRYAEAAAVAKRQGDDDVALEYYLRAQDVDNAAHMAIKLGKMRQAAEIYERAKKYERAAMMYQKLGMDDKAAELRAKVAPAAAPATTAASQGSAASDKASALEEKLREAVANSKGTDADKATIQRLARDAADELLSHGEIRRAADVYRDAGMDDEAIHLYVNVLGSPGEAAPILASRGNHERAAELYELAGAKERAAAAWVKVAEHAPRPDAYLDRIETLSQNVARKFLHNQTSMRALSKESVELFYRYASVLERTGETEQALTLFTTIRDNIGPYRDVYDHISALQSGASTRTRTPVPTQAGGAGTAAGGAAAAGQATASGGAVTAAAPAPGGYKLSDVELQALAMQVAQAAAEQLSKGDDLAKIMASPKIRTQAVRLTAEVQAVGLEQQPLSLDKVFDSEVHAARVGPSIDTLNRFIKGEECTLQNIEVYHRLGLAHLAGGDWEKALAAFDAVEEASPGYREDYKRAEQIRDWQQAMSRLTEMKPASGQAEVSGGSRYQLSGELGRGGMAVVYRGQDSLLGREVALKFLSEELSAQEDMREMFQREARSVAQLNHPNIVTIHDFGVLEGRAFICMEYIDGRSVEQLMSVDQGLTIVETLRITKQALDALAYAHSRQIIHRDIKPANMMRTNAGLVKLMDFGLAKSMSTTSKSSMVAGTPAYMPPEQLSGAQVDHRADIFATGVTIYEMLTGQLPFDGFDRATTPPTLREHVPAIPEILDDAIMKSLALRAEDRFQSAEEFAQPVEQILSAVSRFAGVNKAMNTQSSPAASKPRPASAAATVALSATQAADVAKSAPGTPARRGAAPTVTLKND